MKKVYFLRVKKIIFFVSEKKNLLVKKVYFLRLKKKLYILRVKKVNFLVMNAFNVSPGGGDAVQGHAPFFPGGPESPQDIPPLAAPRLRAQQGEE